MPSTTDSGRPVHYEKPTRFDDEAKLVDLTGARGFGRFVGLEDSAGQGLHLGQRSMGTDPGGPRRC